MRLIMELRKLINSKLGKVSILVHCSSGAGRCGTFIALFQLLEMVDQKMEIYRMLKTQDVKQQEKREDVHIDVFNTVFNMTKQRREMVIIILYRFEKILFAFYLSLFMNTRRSKETVDVRGYLLSNGKVYSTQI